MGGDLAEPEAEQATKPCHPPRLRAILHTRKVGWILLSPSGSTPKKLPPSRCASQDAHQQRPSTRARSEALMGAGRSGMVPALHLPSRQVDRMSEFLYRFWWQRFSSPVVDGGVGGREMENIFV